jgi:signal transduction histidine kinase
MNIARKGDTMNFCIEDQGTGIDDNLLNKLFNVRNIKSLKGTAKESGTGLGLYLCKELVEKNYGKIWAESKINSGSRFYFTLPVKQ